MQVVRILTLTTLTGSLALGGVFMSLWTGEKHTFPLAFRLATTIASPLTGVTLKFSDASGSLRDGVLELYDFDLSMNSPNGSELNLHVNRLSFRDNLFFSKWMKWRQNKDQPLYFRYLSMNGAQGDLELTDKFQLKREKTEKRNRIGFNEVQLEDCKLNVIDSSKFPKTSLIGKFTH